VKVVVCGCGTGLPCVDSSCSSVFVSIGNEKVLLDIGPGAMRQLARMDISYNDIDRLLITHTHIDHINDLSHLLFISKYEVAPRNRDLHIIAPKGFRKFFCNLVSLFGEQIKSEKYEVLIQEAEDSKIELSGWKVFTKPTRHILPGIAYRLEEGDRSLVYTGDTELTTDVVELSKDADLLITECSFPDDERVVGHMTPKSVAALIKQAQPKRVLITHIYPILGRKNAVSLVKSHLDGDFCIEDAYDFMSVEL